ncbi:hypothetical protein [Paraburkholderia caballeronis]|uniref:hypothetical protein n=1 Tax=Paraburkholderia caballeronis TaxID=416943 RepID=UPI000A5732E6|nr:hypothetical protein [Paraburkholderia caballeronis]
MRRPHVSARWGWFGGEPASTIWRANREGLDVPDDLAWQGEGALLLRPVGSVIWRPLSAGGCAFLDACAAGDAFEPAARRALRVEADVDLGVPASHANDSGKRRIVSFGEHDGKRAHRTNRAIGQQCDTRVAPAAGWFPVQLSRESVHERNLRTGLLMLLAMFDCALWGAAAQAWIDARQGARTTHRPAPFTTWTAKGVCSSIRRWRSRRTNPISRRRSPTCS